MKALWGGHTAALQFSIGHRDTVGPKKSRQCEIGDGDGDDIKGGEHVKLRTVMHNACISAINKQGRGPSNGYLHSIWEPCGSMHGRLCIQKDSERKPYNLFTVTRETQYYKVNAIMSYCGYRRLYLHINNVRISHAYHIKMCTWGMQERQVAQFWVKGLRFYTRYP